MRVLRRIDYLDALLADPRCDIHPDTLRSCELHSLKQLAAWYRIPVYPWEQTGTGCVTASDDVDDTELEGSMTASDPRPGEKFRATDNPNEHVTVIESNVEEIRLEREDGSKDTMPRSLFLRDYVPAGSTTSKSQHRQ